uniref:Pp6 n=1 Tax=Clytia hemisphaerica TaxID=252671 RepID=A0A1W6LRY0_9CNID|nr:pp6 precursor [Clytia hemisphaerica]
MARESLLFFLLALHCCEAFYNGDVPRRRSEASRLLMAKDASQKHASSDTSRLLFGKDAPQRHVSSDSRLLFGKDAPQRHVLSDTSRLLFGKDAPQRHVSSDSRLLFGKDAPQRHISSDSRLLFGKDAPQRHVSSDSRLLFGKDAPQRHVSSDTSRLLFGKDAPQRHVSSDTSRLLFGKDVPQRPAGGSDSRTSYTAHLMPTLGKDEYVNALKERLLNDYRMKLLQQQRQQQHQQQEDDDELYFDHSFRRGNNPSASAFRRRYSDQTGQPLSGSRDQKVNQDENARDTLEKKQQASLDQTKEELKRSLLKDFYKKMITEKREKQEFAKKSDAPVSNDFDDEILRHLVEFKLKKEDPMKRMRR